MGEHAAFLFLGEDFTFLSYGKEVLSSNLST
ncbi:hypothetical protein SAMN05216283_11317 [Sunxiuqinia elliptica]|uniref:Uncharacterized protein n=1 Tax=Sunxiuqinia elliptica TaxID=655355 RepID=A0A1I2KPV6_9BACT|nr:hypothetical protein SAMN05216283_11317 [Sunxiuqinia elliptica]